MKIGRGVAACTRVTHVHLKKILDWGSGEGGFGN